MGKEKCSISACSYKALAKSYCSTHYARNKLYGSPLYTRYPNHGGSKTRLYRTWSSIKRRCQNKNTADYPYYGGRGIKVCSEWLGRNGFLHFKQDIGEPPTPQHTLDRIDVNGNYEPGNCRWATRKEQMNNMRRNKLIEYQGTTKTLEQWAESVGIGGHVINKRLNRGWSIAETLSTPVLSSRLGRPNRAAK